MAKTNKKTLLVDVDSTIPNLALMHISAWKKAEGHEVGFGITDPDEIYASVVFDWNRHKLDGLRFLYPDATIDKGGVRSVTVQASACRGRSYDARLLIVSGLRFRRRLHDEGMRPQLSILRSST